MGKRWKERVQGHVAIGAQADRDVGVGAFDQSRLVEFGGKSAHGEIGLQHAKAEDDIGVLNPGDHRGRTHGSHVDAESEWIALGKESLRE